MPLRYLKGHTTRITAATIKKVDTALQKTQNYVLRHRSENPREYRSLFGIPRRNWKETQRALILSFPVDESVFPGRWGMRNLCSRPPSCQAEGVHLVKSSLHLTGLLLPIWRNFELPPPFTETSVCENFSIPFYQNFVTSVLLQCGIMEIMFFT